MSEPSPAAESIIHIRGLRKTYQTGKVTVEALRGIDLDVPAGEFLLGYLNALGAYPVGSKIKDKGCGTKISTGIFGPVETDIIESGK